MNIKDILKKVLIGLGLLMSYGLIIALILIYLIAALSTFNGRITIICIIIFIGIIILGTYLVNVGESI